MTVDELLQSLTRIVEVRPEIGSWYVQIKEDSDELFIVEPGTTEAQINNAVSGNLCLN